MGKMGAFNIHGKIEVNDHPYLGISVGYQTLL